MTPSERTHRNARMILEAASVRHPLARRAELGAWAQWDWAGHGRLRLQKMWDHDSMSASLTRSWVLNGYTIDRETARTILRGILAPRILDEIRERRE